MKDLLIFGKYLNTVIPKIENAILEGSSFSLSDGIIGYSLFLIECGNYLNYSKEKKIKMKARSAALNYTEASPQWGTGAQRVIPFFAI